ncbi:phage holin family protein [Romboutsia hominis]|uniref:Holin_tox_secr: toxin secretion/phage lysis holin n=1 Tax=Romboutsia hominis TaxID=1507512 RepID=A0A2P2BRD2_9FIRM|nr:phage holin family protein [Romboutsia hominis]CEI72920.1 holin_tox_secr: toxin secretion/phage lysis holin [Romboutsia hominis]
MNFFNDLQGNPFISILLIACIWDLFLGILRALKEKKINSSAGINGIIRKVGMIGSALFLKLVDLVIDFNLVAFLPSEFLEIIKINSIGVCELFCLCFIAFETLSAMKNLTRSNIPIPSKLKEFIEYMLDTFTTENNKKDKVGV